MNAAREEDLFALALEQPTGQRGAFLESVCADDTALRRRIEALLAAHETPDPRLGEPAAIIPHGRPLNPPTVKLPERPNETVGQAIGRYKLLEKIGEGGCGVVYVADQTEPVRRRVALKVIKLGMDTDAVVARFEAERQALAMMDHPNIARVFDAGTTDQGRPFFVMELVRGIRITDYCDQAQLSTAERLELFIKVCQAIQHAHQKGIIHRDIKPSNILVTLHDGVPVPKVIDFGIAKATEGRLTDATVYTQLHQFMGTPAYMSPEQAEMSGLDIDTRSDIYSLGVLLYELLAGSTPFDGRELMASGIDAMRKTIREKEPARPSTKLATLRGDDLTTTLKRRSSDAARLLHQVRGDLDWIVMKCLEKDRTRRYETANSLATDLKRHLSNEPIAARPPSTAYRLQKSFRRNRLAFTAAAAVFTMLTGGLAVSTWQMIRATRAEREQNKLRQVAVVALEGEKRQRTQAETEQQRADAEARKAAENQQRSQRLLYVSDMNNAQEALKENNVGKARRLLDRHRPQTDEEDVRGWEWRYLWQLTRSSALVTLTNRPARVFSVSFSPDGLRLAVGWFDGRVELWDVPGRRVVRVLNDTRNSPPGRVAFSAARNLLAGTSAAKTVTLYDLDSGQESVVWRAPEQGTWDVRDIAFSRDGSIVAVYAGNRPLRRDEVWVIDVLSGKVETNCSTLYSEDNHFGTIQLSPDGRYLFVARSDYRAYRYNIQCLDRATSQEVWQTAPQRDQGLTTLAISPDGRILASASGYEDPTIRVWDTTTGRMLVRLDGHTAWVAKLVFSKDGGRLISAASDQTIRLWDTSTWTETRVLRGHGDELHAVAISETAQLLASGSKDGDLMLWKEDGKQAGRHYRLLQANSENYAVRILDESRALLHPPGKPALVCDLKSESPMTPLPAFGFPTSFLRHVTPNIFFHWNRTNQVLMHELHGTEWVLRKTIALNSNDRPNAFAFNVKRQFVAWSFGGRNPSVSVASLAAPHRRIELTNDLPGVSSLSFSPDGTYLCAQFKADFVRVWNFETGRLVLSLDEKGIHPLFSMQEHPLVITVPNTSGQESGHEVRFYDLLHPDRLPRITRGNHFASATVISPDRGLVALPLGSGEVRLFNAATGELIESLHGHLNAVFNADFSPDGHRLITTSGGREAVKLWDINTRQELLTLNGAGSTIETGKWSADGDAILVGPPWQAWLAPTWMEIAAAEANEKTASPRP
jgi:eukaryotic-like serine/threonine-protein kinase